VADSRADAGRACDTAAMDLQMSGWRALLIGAGRGLGGAAAVSLSHEGVAVALVARTRAALDERARLCREAGAPKAAALVADATDPSQLERAVEDAAAALGGLDLLVMSVGGSQPGGTEMDDAGWAAALERNLWPAIRATRLALPFLEASARERGAAGPPSAVDAPGSRRQSVVLHVASIWGREGGGSMSYNAAKAALISLAHEQARELAARGIRVLSVSPGSVLHPGGSWERRLRADPQGIADFVRREIPFGRFGTAEEAGDAIAFLCSPRASWIAGTSVVVDGAQSRSF
jgi:3-oxoacyl-[acyl-carrier protein] reductase